jgi:hypothetical protein
MGCRHSSTEDIEKTPVTISSSTPGPADNNINNTSDKLAKFRVDSLLAEALSKEWIHTFAIKDGETKVTLDMVLKDTLSLLRGWPRGYAAGAFLLKPEISDLPIKERGVKLSWLLAAWNHMTAATQRHLISTRMFVELMARPLVRNEGGEDVTLFDFIPTIYRATPKVYVCHPWDGYFRHILFFPDNLKKQWPADSAVWIDVFAIPQADDSPNSDRLELIRDTITTIGRTVAVFPGDGTPEFAVLTAVRSWCIFEMLTTLRDSLDFRVGLHGDLNDIDFHTKVVQFIDSISVESAKASFNADKDEIDSLLCSNGADGPNSQLRQITRMAFAKRYEAIPTTPTMNARLSSNSQHSSRGRMNSLSDMYVTDEVKALDINNAPDF